MGYYRCMTTHTQPTTPYQASEPFTEEEPWHFLLRECPICAGPLAIRVLYPALPKSPNEVLLLVRCGRDNPCAAPALSAVAQHRQVVEYVAAGLDLPR